MVSTALPNSAMQRPISLTIAESAVVMVMKPAAYELIIRATQVENDNFCKNHGIVSMQSTFAMPLVTVAAPVAMELPARISVAAVIMISDGSLLRIPNIKKAKMFLPCSFEAAFFLSLIFIRRQSQNTLVLVVSSNLVHLSG